MKEQQLLDLFASNIKYYRFKLGYTQEELAEKSNLSVRYISDIENSNGNVPLTTLSNIAECLCVEPYMLIKENKNNSNLPKRVNMK